MASRSEHFRFYLKKQSMCQLRQYWKPPQLDESAPTKREKMKPMPELETCVPCYDQDDHLKQMGMLKCNPKGWDNF